MKFRTESGSVYEIAELDGLEYVRRLNPDYTKRADGDWVRLHLRSEITAGCSVLLVLDSLAGLGPDDNGNPQDNGSDVTQRITSPVEEVWA